MFIFPILILSFFWRDLFIIVRHVSAHTGGQNQQRTFLYTTEQKLLQRLAQSRSPITLCKSMTHQFMQLQKLIFLQKSAVISRDDSPQVVETPCDHQAFPVLPALHKTPTLNTANQYSSADLGNPPHPLSFCKHFVCTFFFFFLILTVYNTGICYTEDSAIH